MHLEMLFNQLKIFVKTEMFNVFLFVICMSLYISYVTCVT